MTGVKPLQEFRGFSRLPPELRIGIWEMAVRPQGINGVNYFTLFKSAGDKENALADLAVANRRFQHHGPWEKNYEELVKIEYRAAAPRISAHGNDLSSPASPASPVSPEYSWFKGNQSLYAWDAGLFNACTESRRIICKYVNSNRTWGDWVIKGQHNGQTQYFRDHRLDLFCFEFDREAIEASMSIRWGILLQQLAFRCCTMSQAHIAFEFDPSWVTSLPGEDEPFDLHQEVSPRGLVARVFDAWCHRETAKYLSLWLIDRSIQVNETLPYTPCTFVDLQNTYISVESRDLFYGRGKTKRERSTAFYLCKRLNKRKRSIRGAPRCGCLGVLACLPPNMSTE